LKAQSLHAHIFKMPEQISVIFGLLQRRYILNTSVDSIFIKHTSFGHFEDMSMQRSEPSNVVASLFLDHPVDSFDLRCSIISRASITKKSRKGTEVIS